MLIKGQRHVPITCITIPSALEASPTRRALPSTKVLTGLALCYILAPLRLLLSLLSYLGFFLRESFCFLVGLVLFRRLASFLPAPPPFCLVDFTSVPPSSAHSNTQACLIILQSRTQSNNSFLFLDIGNLQSFEHWKFVESHLFKQMSPLDAGFLLGADDTIQRMVVTKMLVGEMSCIVI